jgi:hypothetical protein
VRRRLTVLSPVLFSNAFHVGCALFVRQHSKGPAGTRLPQGVGLGLDRSGPQPQAGEDAPFTPAVPSSGAAGADGMMLASALYPLRLFCCA